MGRRDYYLERELVRSGPIYIDFNMDKWPAFSRSKDREERNRINAQRYHERIQCAKEYGAKLHELILGTLLGPSVRYQEHIPLPNASRICAPDILYPSQGINRGIELKVRENGREFFCYDNQLANYVYGAITNPFDFSYAFMGVNPNRPYKKGKLGGRKKQANMTRHEFLEHNTQKISRAILIPSNLMLYCVPGMGIENRTDSFKDKWGRNFRSGDLTQLADAKSIDDIRSARFKLSELGNIQSTTRRLPSKKTIRVFRENPYCLDLLTKDVHTSPEIIVRYNDQKYPINSFPIIHYSISDVDKWLSSLDANLSEILEASYPHIPNHFEEDDAYALFDATLHSAIQEQMIIRKSENGEEELVIQSEDEVPF